MTQTQIALEKWQKLEAHIQEAEQVLHELRKQRQKALTAFFQTMTETPPVKFWEPTGKDAELVPEPVTDVSVPEFAQDAAELFSLSTRSPSEELRQVAEQTRAVVAKAKPSIPEEADPIEFDFTRIDDPTQPAGYRIALAFLETKSESPDLDKISARIWGTKNRQRLAVQLNALRSLKILEYRARGEHPYYRIDPDAVVNRWPSGGLRRLKSSRQLPASASPPTTPSMHKMQFNPHPKPRGKAAAVEPKKEHFQPMSPFTSSAVAGKASPSAQKVIDKVLDKSSLPKRPPLLQRPSW